MATLADFMSLKERSLLTASRANACAEGSNEDRKGSGLGHNQNRASGNSHQRRGYDAYREDIDEIVLSLKQFFDSEDK